MRDLVISREYGWLARQRYAAFTCPVGMDIILFIRKMSDRTKRGI